MPSPTTVERAGVGETFTIYSSLPLQGDSRPQSADIARAMRMALRDNGGRAGGHRITYISLDDASPAHGFWDPERAAVNARKAASNPRTIAYLGEFNSGASTVSMPILNRAGVLQVSPSNTIVGLTRALGGLPGEPAKYYPTGRRTYGRVVPADLTQAAAVVSYMTDQGCASAYIINNRDIYGRGIAAHVERDAARRGFPILGNDGIDDQPASVRAAAARVTASGADCFFYAGFTQRNTAVLFKTVGAFAPAMRLFGPDGIAEAFFTEKLGPALVPAGVHHEPDARARRLPAARAAVLRGLQGPLRPLSRALRDLRLRGDERRPQLDPARRRRARRCQGPPGRGRRLLRPARAPVGAGHVRHRPLRRHDAPGLRWLQARRAAGSSSTG